jgi:hypothetical protein
MVDRPIHLKLCLLSLMSSDHALESAGELCGIHKRRSLCHVVDEYLGLKLLDRDTEGWRCLALKLRHGLLLLVLADVHHGTLRTYQELTLHALEDAATDHGMVLEKRDSFHFDF